MIERRKLSPSKARIGIGFIPAHSSDRITSLSFRIVAEFPGRRAGSPRRVQKFRDGMGPYGTYDTVGNVREWVWNQSGNRRWILGGAWTDRPYMARFRYSLPAFDRAPINGFRTVKYLTGEPLPENLTAPRLINVRDDRDTN